MNPAFFSLFIVVFVFRPSTTLPSVSTSCPASWSTYWPTSWPTSWPTFYCVLSSNELLILILPFRSIFSTDAALVLVDALLSLNVLLLLVEGGPISWRVYCHALLKADIIVYMIENPDFINILGTPECVLVLGVPGPGKESNFSTVLVILPDLLFPDPDEPVVVINVVSSVILNSGIDFFSLSGLFHNRLLGWIHIRLLDWFQHFWVYKNGKVSLWNI